MEARRAGDGLDVGIGGEVRVRSRNGWKLPFTQTRDGLSERATQIGVLRAAAVARPPAGVHGEMHEVGEPPDLLGAGRFTARQIAKLIQVDGIGALGNQVRVDEGHVAELILGIVVDILGHIRIEHLKAIYAGLTAAPATAFAALHASQFVVPLPEIAVDAYASSE